MTTLRNIVIDAACYAVSAALVAGMAAWAWDRHMESLSEFHPPTVFTFVE